METDKQEQYWSRFAVDFEARNNYVVGINNMEVVLSKVRELTNLKNTLELGCGNGTYSRVLVESADRLAATDFSDQMVAVSKDRFKSNEKVTVEKADCSNLHYPDATFDTVFMANLLHIIPDPTSALHETHRVLKRNGRIIVLDFNTEEMSFVNKLLLYYRYFKTYGKPSKYNQELTLNTITEMLAQSNYYVLESGLVGIDMKAAYIIAEKRSK